MGKIKNGSRTKDYYMAHKINFEFISNKIFRNSFIFTGEINDKDLIDKLIEDTREGVKISTISGKTNVKGTHTEFEYFVNNSKFHKFFRLIQPSIFEMFKKNLIIKDAWGNICNKNDEVIEHTHLGTTGFCGILYLTDNGPGTYFKDFDILVEEKIGKYVIFDPLLYHSVEKITEQKERITIAFNIDLVSPWIDYNKSIFIKK